DQHCGTVRGADEDGIAALDAEIRQAGRGEPAQIIELAKRQLLPAAAAGAEADCVLVAEALRARAQQRADAALRDWSERLRLDHLARSQLALVDAHGRPLQALPHDAALRLLHAVILLLCGRLLLAEFLDHLLLRRAGHRLVLGEFHGELAL